MIWSDAKHTHVIKYNPKKAQIHSAVGTFGMFASSLAASLRRCLCVLCSSENHLTRFKPTSDGRICKHFTANQARTPVRASSPYCVSLCGKSQSEMEFSASCKYVVTIAVRVTRKTDHCTLTSMRFAEGLFVSCSKSHKFNNATGQIAAKHIQRTMETNQDDGRQWDEQYFIANKKIPGMPFDSVR